MAIKRMPINRFVAELYAAYQRGDGYIMGATGQDPKKWSKNSWWFTQYDKNAKQKAKALYWREHAHRVWDCNGMSEGIYKDYAGVDINTKARFNYSQWCSQKGTGMIPTYKRVPGMAVFWGDNGKPGTIHHVAYLYKPVIEGHPEGNWYIIEARGVMYGVVMTKLYSRNPNFWGKMDKYFDYGDTITSTTTTPKYSLGDRILKRGMFGNDVVELQELLISLNYNLPKYGSDGDFGSETESAVRAFQLNNRIPVTGEVNSEFLNVLKTLIVSVSITGLLVNVRSGPGTEYKIIGVVTKGTTLQYLNSKSENGWYKVKYNDKEAWVSGKYAEAK